MDQRVVRLHGPFEDEAATSVIIQQLLFLQYEDRHQPITVDIDSPGGSVVGCLATIDTIGFLEAPVHTRCTGRAYGGAAIILAAGTRGHRTVGPLARIALTPITTTESDPDPRGLERDRDLLAALLAKFTGRPVPELVADLTTGRTLTPAAAVAYGLADAVEVPAEVSPEEAAWLSCSDPVRMLDVTPNPMCLRKGLLYAVACRRRVATWDYFPEAAAVTDAAERWADGQNMDDERQRAYEAVYNVREKAGRMILGDPDSGEPNDGTAGYWAIEAAVDLVQLAHSMSVGRTVWQSCSRATWFGDHTPDRSQAAAELRAQAALVRCIFGNPYRPVAFDPRWRTADVVGLALGIYEERAFERLPLLADALMDAGCADEQVIGHCRGEGPHARGCWVVDAVLGKE